LSIQAVRPKGAIEATGARRAWKLARGRVLYEVLDAQGNVERVVEDIVASQQPKKKKKKETFISYARVSIRGVQDRVRVHKKEGRMGKYRTMDYPLYPGDFPEDKTQWTKTHPRFFWEEQL
jgi:hypothetical protein